MRQQITAWVVIFSLLVPSAAVFAGPEDELEAEAKRIERAYESFTDEDFAKMRGKGTLQRVTDGLQSIANTLTFSLLEDAVRTQNDSFTQAELDIYLKTPSSEKRTEALMMDLYKETIGFLQRVGKSDLSEKKQAELMAQVNEATGKAFVSMTEHFEDPVGAPPPLQEVLDGTDSKGQAALAIMAWTTHWLLHKGRYILKGVISLCRGEAIPLPLIQGRSERRSAATEALANEVRYAIRADAARIRAIKGGWLRSPKNLVLAVKTTVERVLGKADERNPEQIAMTLVGLEELLKVTEASEVVRFGAGQRVMRSFYLVCAFLFVYLGAPQYGPLMGWDWGFFSAPTTAGELPAIVQWAGGMLWLARSRRQNSGLQYHRELFGATVRSRLALLPVIGRRGLFRELEILEGNPLVEEYIPHCQKTYAAAAKRN